MNLWKRSIADLSGLQETSHKRYRREAYAAPFNPKIKGDGLIQTIPLLTRRHCSQQLPSQERQCSQPSCTTVSPTHVEQVRPAPARPGPFAGFLHVDRPSKPSLVLDLVEEFRQPVVDRTVIAHLNLGEAVTLKAGMLDEETCSRYAAKILERLESNETVKGKKYQIKSIIQMQARNLCAFLRREGGYRPCTFKW